MYVTLKLDGSDGAAARPWAHAGFTASLMGMKKERYVVMPWKMVTRYGTNVTLKEAVEEIKKREEDRRSVSKFEAEHRDEIFEILGVIDYIDKGFVKERFPKIYNFGPERLGIHFKDKFVLEEYSSGYPINRRYSQLDYFKKTIKAYQGRDADAVKYVESVKALIDKPLDQVVLEDVRAIRKKVKFPCKLDISVFYQLIGRLPHEELEDFIIHFCDTFVAASIKLLGKTVRCRINVLYHLLKKIGKEPNADVFPFMEGASHQRAEEEIKFVFDHLGWSYSSIPLLASKV